MHSWAAPRASGPVRASVPLPGSKSLTNRLLVLAALADGPSRLIAPLQARDTLLMAGALQTPGRRGHRRRRRLVVTPGPLHGGSVDVGLAGTVMRFVPPVAALADGAGGLRRRRLARERPMATLLDGLRQAGVDGRRRRPRPAAVHRARHAARCPAARCSIDASASSQFVSGLLLAGARYDKGLEVVHDRRRRCRRSPHIEMTLAVLRAAGRRRDRDRRRRLAGRPGPGRGRRLVVEPDLSNAAPFLAAALVTGGDGHACRLAGRARPRPATRCPTCSRAMGAEVSLDGDGADGDAAPATVLGLDADLRDVGELAPVLAALAALADWPVAAARHRPPARPRDRPAGRAGHASSPRLGGDVTEHRRRPAHHARGRCTAATWHAYADHRMATAGAVLGLAVDGVEVDDIGCTTKTLPDFPRLWSALLGG